MKYLREETIVTDFVGKHLELFQKIFREPVYKRSKTSKTTDGTRYPNLPCAPAATIRKRKAAVGANDKLFKRNHAVAGSSKTLPFTSLSSLQESSSHELSIPTKTIQQHDEERFQRRKEEKQRIPIRPADLPASKFADEEFII